MFSLTPATRAASICSTLERLGLQQLLEHHPVGTCSPVATGTGDASGDGGVAEHVVGAGRLLDPGQVVRRPAAPTQAIASATSQRWLASMAIRMSGPTTSRAMPSGGCRRSRSAPTFSLIWAKPSATASRPGGPASRRSSPASPAWWCTPGSRLRSSSASRAPRVPGSARAQDLQRLVAGERVGEVAEVDQVDQLLRRHARRAAATAAGRRAWP